MLCRICCLSNKEHPWLPRFRRFSCNPVMPKEHLRTKAQSTTQIKVLGQIGHQHRLAMGMFKSFLSFCAGTTFGIYVAQTYNLPPLRVVVDRAIAVGKQLEDAYRKRDQGQDPDQSKDKN
ncbi:unnamed protein product [Closterium sp. NIES-54]